MNLQILNHSKEYLKLSKKNNFLKKLNLLLKELNIKRNDNLIIHSNTAGIFQFNNRVEENLICLFLKSIKKKIGQKGTIIIPTYNYDFTKGKIYHSKKSLSKVGFLSNYLLKKNQNNRTNEPVFSHLIFGYLKKKLLKCNTSEAFGNKSIFSEMEKFKFKILCFCCSPNNITFLHYIEKKFNVKYRYNKYFSGFIQKKKKEKFFYKYFVGNNKFDYSIKNKKIIKLIDNINFKEKKFGKFYCYYVNCSYLIKVLREKILHDKYYLIK